jgi:hypothetical protein
MNSQIFIETIKEVVIESSIKGIEEILEQPPGRKPDQKLIELSNWFKNNENQSIILSLVRESVEMGVFGFLCVLDGVRAIENKDEKGILKLIYESKDESVLLNDREGEYLHDLL